MKHLISKKKHKNNTGFTIIELMIVLTILSILATLIAPSFLSSTDRAKEATLKANLFIFRDTIDQFRADQGRYPDVLSELVEMKYLRAIPVDPFTSSAETWVEVPVSAGAESGTFDVHSGSDLKGINEIPYNQW